MVDAMLKPETIKVSKLVEDYRSGRIVIPEFQREYVWKPSKAPLLFTCFIADFPSHRYFFGKAQRRHELAEMIRGRFVELL